MKQRHACILSIVLGIALCGPATAQKVYLLPDQERASGHDGAALYSYAHSCWGKKLPKSNAANVIKTSRGRVLAVTLGSVQRGKDVLDDICVLDISTPGSVRAYHCPLDGKFEYDNIDLKVMNDSKRGQVVAICPHADLGNAYPSKLDTFAVSLDNLYRWREDKARMGGYDLQVGEQSYKASFSTDNRDRPIFTLFDKADFLSGEKRIKPRHTVLLFDFVNNQNLKVEKQPIGDTGYYLELAGTTNTPTVTTRDGGAVPKTASDTEKIYAASKPAVAYLTHFDGDGVRSGTGFLCNKAGDIVTNKHVVQGAPDDTVTVKYFDGATTTGRVVARDATYDLALVRPSKKPSDLRILEFGPTTPRVGETLLVIGHPEGFKWSLTKGTVSAVRDPGDTHAPGFLQTDAAINPGNSGGPAINLDGKVVGVVTLKAKAEGIGLALPAKLASEFVRKHE